MYPKFIGIGAQKAGTTWLHRNLQTHPEIWMPKNEVHYFDRKIHDRSNAVTRLFGGREVDEQWRRQVRHWLKVHTLKKPSITDLLWDFRYFMRPYNDKWYGSIFEPSNGRTTGEITPAYASLDRNTVEHIYRLMPDTKIIFVMRNPIERDWSQTVMSFDKVEKGSAQSASEALLLQRTKRKGSRPSADYLRTLENWTACYPEEQIFAGFTEDIHFVPEGFLERMYEFLGVDTSYNPPKPNKKVHSRSADKMPTSVAVEMARVYHSELTRLADCFGGYVSFWLYCAERLIDEPPETKNISYPLYRSYLWDVWVENSNDSSKADLRKLGPQSGPLSMIKALR